MQLHRNKLIILAATLLSFAAGFGIAHPAPRSSEGPAVAERMALCIEKLAEVTSERNLAYEYGVVEYRYDAERDLCLYRGNRMEYRPQGLYFEKYIIDAFTDTTVAFYNEMDGRPVTGDLSEFSATLDELFPDVP